VAAQLEDTLVSGYTRLAAETPRRRTDIELRVLDIFFASVFGLLLLPVAGVIALFVFVTSGRPVLYRGHR
jgi:lipopolysaccharide/colanic/teichoic acid biosynthesis glycosyltransferase